MAEVIKTAAPMWAEDYDSLVELLESIGDGTYDSQTRPGAVPDSTARS